MSHRAALARGNLSPAPSNLKGFGARLNNRLQTLYSTPLVLPADRVLPDAPNQTQPKLTFRNSCGQGGLAVVHMADGTHIHMGLIAHVGLLGLHGKTATQKGRCPGFQWPQTTLQQWGRAGTETCGERSLGKSRKWIRTQLPRCPLCLQVACTQPAPSPLKRGVARNRVAAAIVGLHGDRDRKLGTGNPRVQERTGTCDYRSLPAETRVGRASLGASSRQFLWPWPLISGYKAEEEDFVSQGKTQFLQFSLRGRF